MKTYDLRNYRISNTDILLFDTCIWLDIESSFSYTAWSSNFSQKVYKYALTNKATILITDHIISEFINTVCRFEWKYYKESNNIEIDYKEFRKRSDFVPIADNLSKTIKRILKTTKLVKFDPDVTLIESVMDNFASGKYDCNDMYIAEIAKQNDAILVTNDADYKEFDDLKILTANLKLLN